MTLWQRLFGDLDGSSPVRPILLRLDLRGVPCPSRVLVAAEWSPSREVACYELMTSSSMVLVPWRGDSRGVELTVRACGAVGRAAVRRADNRDGAVIDLSLEPERLAS